MAGREDGRMVVSVKQTEGSIPPKVLPPPGPLFCADDVPLRPATMIGTRSH